MRNVKVILEEIAQAFERMTQIAGGCKLETFRQDRDAQDIICWNVIKVGEAVKQIPGPFKKKYSAIPWRQMAGMRDVLIHQYHRIDVEELWRTASVDAVSLRQMVDKCILDQGDYSGTSCDVPSIVKEKRARYKVLRKRQGKAKR